MKDSLQTHQNNNTHSLSMYELVTEIIRPQPNF